MDEEGAYIYFRLMGFTMKTISFQKGNAKGFENTGKCDAQFSPIIHSGDIGRHIPGKWRIKQLAYGQRSIRKNRIIIRDTMALRPIYYDTETTGIRAENDRIIRNCRL